ncbi:SAF domain-containing protein [Amycolatopsis pigmentata]|uniref:SAF domain-containing protein n=1 Tax=Amycolatopsis pigmentata TaxID=450801 RepID=A0ABW5G7R1_9PSEU
MGNAVSFSRPQPRDSGAGDAPRVPRRRRWWLLAVAVVLAAAAAFGNVAVISGQDKRIEVLVLARPVSWGQRIGDEDLEVGKAVPYPNTAVILSRDRAAVVGAIARATLPAGTVLAPGQLTQQPVPGPGERLVGLPVKPGRLPARGLSPGDLVQATPVAGEAGTDATPQSAAGPFRARVLEVGLPDSTGAVTVDVVVGPDAAPAATAAAAGQVVLVQLGPGT